MTSRKVFEIKDYVVSLGKPAKPRESGWNYEALIACYGDDSWALMIYFSDSRIPPPATNKTSLSTKIGYLYPPIEQFSWFVDILRNEKAIFALIDEAKPEINHLRTNKEPVGEQE